MVTKLPYGEIIEKYNMYENIILRNYHYNSVCASVNTFKNIKIEPVPKRMKIQHFQQERGLMDLSNEVLELIFLQLSQSDIQQNLALVCRRFLNIKRHPKFVQAVEIEPIGKKKKWDQLQQKSFSFSVL